MNYLILTQEKIDQLQIIIKNMARSKTDIVLTKIENLLPIDTYAVYIPEEYKQHISKKLYPSYKTECECKELGYKICVFDLEAVFTFMKNKVEEYKNERLNNNVIYAGTEYNSQQKDREAMQGMVTNLQILLSSGVTIEPFPWIPFYNYPPVYFTYQEFFDFSLRFANYYSQVTFTSRFHKDFLISITTQFDKDDETIMQELLSYDYKVNWPSNDLGGTLE
jgi:hypothetical protein